MHLFISIQALLGQLEVMLQELPGNSFTRQLPVLSGATIGQHTRHILEFFIELDKGYTTGVVCYDKRQRDSMIESDLQTASDSLRTIRDNLERPDKHIMLQLVQERLTVSTNYYRELVYNAEHTLHHMALLRIGLESLATVSLPEEFGVAPSTIRYRKECVQ